MDQEDCTRSEPEINGSRKASRMKSLEQDPENTLDLGDISGEGPPEKGAAIGVGPEAGNREGLEKRASGPGMISGLDGCEGSSNGGNPWPFLTSLAHSSGGELTKSKVG